MANQIERDVYVTYEPLKNPISYVRGTNALPIIFHFRDYDIPEGAAANVVVVKPSGKGVYNPATISGNDVTVTVDQQMFIELGTSELQVSISQSGQELVTFAQPVWVKPNYKDGDFPPSESSSEFLDDILNGANDAVQKADAALANAETALQDATEASTTAQQAASTAQSAATTANQASTTAQQAATDAQTALTNANQALQDADQAIQSVQESVQNMNTNFASLANTAEISTLTTENQTAVGAINELMAIKAPGIPLTATGEQISVDDASGNKFLGLKIYGKGEQVKTTGAQLLKYPYDEPYRVSNRITYQAQNDGSIKITGTASGDSFFNIFKNADGSRLVLDPGQYIYSGSKDGVSIVCRKVNNESSTTLTENVPFSLVDGDELCLYLYIQTGKTINTTIYVMLNAGSSPLPWEPYTGGQPSPSVAYPQEVHKPGESGSMNVNVMGSNLLDESEFQTASTIKYIYIAVPINRKITMYTDIPLNSSGGAYVFLTPSKIDSLVGFTTSSNGVWNGNTKTIESIDGYATVAYRENNAGDHPIDFKNYKFMVNIGESALPYEPYKPIQTIPITTPNGLPGIPVESGGNYTDQNGQQWISDVRDEEAGKYYQYVQETTFEGSADENWVVSRNADGYYQFTVHISKNQKSIGTISTTENDDKMLSYIGIGNDPAVQKVEGLWIYQSDTVAIVLKSELLTDYSVSALKTWLQSNPVTIVYPLANPIVTDLPAEETAAYNAIHTNNPNTNIFTDQDVQPGMEAKYVGDTQIYVDKKFQTLQDSISNLVAEATANFINNANVTDITQLGTTSKTLVGAINEINNK